MIRFISLFFMIMIGACTARESGKGIKESQAIEEPAVDSMPVVEPEVPETANVIVPQIQDSMPVVEPESIEIPE